MIRNYDRQKWESFCWQGFQMKDNNNERRKTVTFTSAKSQDYTHYEDQKHKQQQ